MNGKRHSELAKSSEKGAKWSDHAIEVHGIDAEKVAGARDHVVVLKDCLSWMVTEARAQAVAQGVSPADFRVALNCHNGSACDLDWLFHYIRRYGIQIPPEIECYFDTLSIVKASPAHKCNKAKHDGPMALEGLCSLGNLIEAMFGARYDDEHDAGADAEAGSKVLSHEVGATAPAARRKSTTPRPPKSCA